ncbi:unnamed protein product [Pleuronectes platessa]|uniref:Uncharacterized protein n=1 Tax=Pleuronectes platessa TaxID=8262 RepID=A0A9N7YJQ3_PLEPL|nr:unnamed protein product [Pleuronectes platessa]
MSRQLSGSLLCSQCVETLNHENDRQERERHALPAGWRAPTRSLDLTPPSLPPSLHPSIPPLSLGSSPAPVSSVKTKGTSLSGGDTFQWAPPVARGSRGSELAAGRGVISGQRDPLSARGPSGARSSEGLRADCSFRPQDSLWISEKKLPLDLTSLNHLASEDSEGSGPGSGHLTPRLLQLPPGRSTSAAHPETSSSTAERPPTPHTGAGLGWIQKHLELFSVAALCGTWRRSCSHRPQTEGVWGVCGGG